VVSPRKAAAVEVSREVVSVVLVRHASGVEDSFLWPPKNALGGTSLKSNFASLFYSKQREKERGTKSEE
jgi:hypothetical protein